MQALKAFGSFHVGGRTATLEGLPVTRAVITQGAPARTVDPNGEFEVEQMYVQYLVPEPTRAKYPLLMWHGGGVTGVCWDTKPDGAPGWMQYFFEAGHAIYVSDAVERGRASWSRFPEICHGEPIFRSKREAWGTFRIGPEHGWHSDPASRVAFANGKFPVAAFDQLARQFVPRWNVNDEATLAAYLRELQLLGPSVLMVHSQSGVFAFAAAMALPDLVKGIVAVEPAGAPPAGPALDQLRDIPILILWGDHVDQHGIWREQQPASRAFARDLNGRAGKVEWIELPEIGIAGNSHMLMMDCNSDEIASLIQDWMERSDLMQPLVARGAAGLHAQAVTTPGSP
jgi:hypothetical protein